MPQHPVEVCQPDGTVQEDEGGDYSRNLAG